MVPHISGSALLRSFRRLATSLFVAIGVLIAIGGAIVAQAGRDEGRGADIALVMLDGSDGGQAARLERVLRLYLGGQISRVILAGSTTTPARDSLVARGVVAEKIVEVHDATELDQIVDAQKVIEDTHAGDVLLVGEPVKALRLLKIARDRDLALHSAPTGADTSISIGSVVEEIGRYLTYCFAGR